MTTLKKNSQDTHDISCPVLATEIGNIYILDPQNFTVLHQVRTIKITKIQFMSRITELLLRFKIKEKYIQKSVDFRIRT